MDRLVRSNSATKALVALAVAIVAVLVVTALMPASGAVGGAVGGGTAAAVYHVLDRAGRPNGTGGR
jgi:hypothetical protein